MITRYERFFVLFQFLADCGYLGFWRVLNAQYFGVPQKRRRIFLVAGFRQFPPMEFLADAGPVEAVPCSFGAKPRLWSPGDDWSGHTLQACNSSSRISIGSELLVAEKDG
jgi:DNA (cytosine-5)-methyltransferase 1